MTRRSSTPAADGFVTCTPSCNAGPICAEHWSAGLRQGKRAGRRRRRRGAGAAGQRQRRVVPGVPIAGRIPRDQADEQSPDSEHDGDRRQPEDRPVTAAQLHDIIASRGAAAPWRGTGPRPLGVTAAVHLATIERAAG